MNWKLRYADDSRAKKLETARQLAYSLTRPEYARSPEGQTAKVMLDKLVSKHNFTDEELGRPATTPTTPTPPTPPPTTDTTPTPPSSGFDWSTSGPSDEEVNKSREKIKHGLMTEEGRNILREVGATEDEIDDVSLRKGNVFQYSEYRKNGVAHHNALYFMDKGVSANEFKTLSSMGLKENHIDDMVSNKVPIPSYLQIRKNFPDLNHQQASDIFTQKAGIRKYYRGRKNGLNHSLALWQATR